MTSLKSVLAFNMKTRRQILEITQAQLAERVNTSTNYIALIETEKRFPHAEMLERIAAALEIDPPALFSTKSYPSPAAGTLSQFHELVLSDVSEVISNRIQQLGQCPPQFSPLDKETGETLA